MQITVSTLVPAPITEVWRAYTSPEDIQQWNAASDDWHTTAATVDLRVGGPVQLAHGSQRRLVWL
jgi:uncharacterized protein YndB with AHSA1/START domain